MPYNRETALKNQKDFLRSQMYCGHHEIERRARETLAKIEKQEKAQDEFTKKIRAQNAQLAADRLRKDAKHKGGTHAKPKKKKK